jgi:hypothetical protein
LKAYRRVSGFEKYHGSMERSEMSFFNHHADRDPQGWSKLTRNFSLIFHDGETDSVVCISPVLAILM